MTSSSVPLDRRAFARGAVALLAITLPLAYACELGAVAVHELLGHGLTSWLMGGGFHGFTIRLESGGFARTDDAAHPTIVLAAGVVVSLALAAVLIVVAPRLRARPLVSLALLLFTACLVEVNAPDAFWGSWYGRGASDFGLIVAASGDKSVQRVLIAVFEVVTIVGTYAWNRLLFRWIEDHLGPLTRVRALFPIVLVGGTATAVLGFPVIAGAGATPIVAGIALDWTIAISLLATRRTDVERRPITTRQWQRGIAASWGMAVVVVASVLLWFRHGVSW